MLSHNNICVFCIQCINKGDVVFISSRVSDDYVCAFVCVYVVGFYQHMHTKLPFTHCRCHFAAMYTIFHQRFAWFRVLLSNWGFACILTEQIFTTRQFSVSFCRVSVRTHHIEVVLFSRCFGIEHQDWRIGAVQLDFCVCRLLFLFFYFLVINYFKSERSHAWTIKRK